MHEATLNPQSVRSDYHTRLEDMRFDEVLDVAAVPFEFRKTMLLVAGRPTFLEVVTE